MTGSRAPAARQKAGKHARRSRGLIIIGVLKLLKGSLFIALGFGLLKLLHRDLYAIAMKLVETLRFDPGNTFIYTLLDDVSLVNDHRLRQLSLLTFAYAGLDFLEGTGLVLQKAWAEYVTLALTASFLPIEILKTIQHFTWWKLLLIVANISIVLYLVWLLQRQEAPKMKLKRA